MKRVMVRYRVMADRAEENITYIRKVFQELEANSPPGLRYASFHLADGVSFIHIASVETADGNNPLSETEAFKQFQAGIRQRCEVPPSAEELTEIGSYRVFD